MTEEKNLGACPHSIFEPYDLLYSSLGNYECKAQGIEYGQYGEPTGYYICKEKDYKECSVYKRDLEKRVEEND